MNTFKKYLVPLLLLALLMGSLAGVRSFFMINVIEPIALVFWAAWRVVASVDQQIYWILLIASCFLLVLRLVPTRSDGTLKGAYNYIYKSGNRVEYWKNLITDTMLGKEEAEDLRDAMKKLLASTIRKTEESGPIDLEKMVVTGKVPLSDDVQRFLFPPKRSSKPSSLYSQFHGSFLRPGWLRSKSRGRNHPDSRSMDEILKWIETEMEISNDK